MLVVAASEWYVVEYTNLTFRKAINGLLPCRFVSSVCSCEHNYSASTSILALVVLVRGSLDMHAMNRIIINNVSTFGYLGSELHVVVEILF